MGIKQSNICNYCTELDSLTHFFFNCLNLKSFWKQIDSFLYQILKVNLNITTTIALFGIKAEDVCANQTALNEANHLLILAKVCISKYKYSKKKQDLKFILEYEMMLRKKYFKIVNNLL